MGVLVEELPLSAELVLPASPDIPPAPEDIPIPVEDVASPPADIPLVSDEPSTPAESVPPSGKAPPAWMEAVLSPPAADALDSPVFSCEEDFPCTARTWPAGAEGCSVASRNESGSKRVFIGQSACGSRTTYQAKSNAWITIEMSRNQRRSGVFGAAAVSFITSLASHGASRLCVVEIVCGQSAYHTSSERNNGDGNYINLD